MAIQGTATLDFGAFPGASDASIAVASATIGASNLVECWIFPATTTDHSVDEHLVEQLLVRAGNIVAGVGFTIYGVNTDQVSEPGEARSMVSNLAEPRIYGKWNIAWVWN